MPVTKIKGYLQQQHPEADNEIIQLPFNGHFGDNFSLAIPYRNAKGQITGFLKRATSPRGITVTTKDGVVHNSVRWDSTAGLKKSDIFNLSACRGQQDLLIVEGYPDAVYFTALGMPHVVAVGQGLLSESHLEGLRLNRVKNVIISFDNDEVGPRNTCAAIKLLLAKTDITPYVLDPKLLGIHKDPMSLYVRKGWSHSKPCTRRSVRAPYGWLSICSKTKRMKAPWENRIK